MWQSDYVEANSLKLHYTRTGGDKPPLILAHGITDNGLCWTDVAEVLEADYDVIMVDARGHGLSDAPETDYEWASHAEDIHGVIHALQLEKPILLGHSMGAMTALIFAGRYPDIPKAILLEDPPSMWMPQKAEDAERRDGISEWIMSLKDKNREELLAAQQQATPHWSESELKNWADSKVQVRQNVANLGAITVEWSSHLAQIVCPVLLITGDSAQGAIVTPEAAAQLKSQLAQVQVEQIAGAGHSIHRDKFDEYMHGVQAFLNSL